MMRSDLPALSVYANEMTFFKLKERLAACIHEVFILNQTEVSSLYHATRASIRPYRGLGSRHDIMADAACERQTPLST